MMSAGPRSTDPQIVATSSGFKVINGVPVPVLARRQPAVPHGLKQAELVDHRFDYYLLSALQ